jgi:hypothetical protein
VAFPHSTAPPKSCAANDPDCARLADPAHDYLAISERKLAELGTRGVTVVAGSGLDGAAGSSTRCPSRFRQACDSWILVDVPTGLVCEMGAVTGGFVPVIFSFFFIYIFILTPPKTLPTTSTRRTQRKPCAAEQRVRRAAQAERLPGRTGALYRRWFGQAVRSHDRCQDGHDALFVPVPRPGCPLVERHLHRCAGCVISFFCLFVCLVAYLYLKC